jgi:hypothetical protein
MNDEKLGGTALIAGALGFLVTMALHPTGHDLFEPGGFEAGARLAAGAHALAIAMLPLTLLGLLALVRHVDDPRRLALAGLVVYGFGAVAAMAAAIASGLVGPELVGELLASAPDERDRWHALLELATHVNQACARVLVCASSAGIALVSVALLRRGARVLGAYGLVLAAVTLAALLSGHLRLDVHGFGAVVLGQAAWSIGAGVLLLRARAAPCPYPGAA